jgi:hypothetical protein
MPYLSSTRLAIRSLDIWVFLMAAETIHGTLRALFLAPVIGDLPARQASVFIGSALIFAITFLLIRRFKSATTQQLLEVGLLWVILTVVFEFIVGKYLLQMQWDRLWSDYDLAAGGLMPIGLLIMALSPLLAYHAKFSF